ncbi:NAD(P)H-hydrate dehydratase [Kangiella sp.]|uniref:NAD(P)H-hydrate dehydratase n=1 Tax=Kangiella sp. TaxID=1920245 RepID=UPI0019A95E99|nr:NAD(P)H-hydrate dehydratase [Kangiella sp.]MBD3652870.1 NAD(P)H-hydrate dehydratase [Kangiella sp.]
MHPVFTADSIKMIEQAAAKAQGFALFELMERAGRAAFDCMEREWPLAHRVVIVTGSGNNAGDGLILAGLALRVGMQVTLVPIKPLDELTGDAAKAWQQLKDKNIAVKAPSQGLFEQADVIVDALLGTGFKGQLREEYAQVIEQINQSGMPVLALDLPSGVYADSGLCADSHIKADHTVSFIFYKVCQVINEGLAAQGELHLATLGISQSQFYQQQPIAWKQSYADVIDEIPERSATTYKQACGHLLCIGGDFTMGGAIMLATETALRAGAGLVTTFLHPDNRSAALGFCPEAMWHGVAFEELSFNSLIEASPKQYDAVVLGPGLGRSEWARQVFEQSFSYAVEQKLPCLIDGDGLFWLQQLIEQDENLALPQALIVTPHPGEAARLLSWDTATVSEDRITAAKAIAERYRCICLLKGAGTILADGQQLVIAGGAHPAMATAGLGDVLSGLIGSLLVQGMSAWDATRVATSIHFAAGVEAAGDRTRGMLASELIEAINYLVNR